jgi:hypothetical protein
MPESPKTLAKRTVQSHIGDDNTRSALVLWLATGTEIMPPWWSKRRDIELRRFWKGIDPLAGAVYALEAKLATIPFHVEPKDYTIRSHAEQADKFELMLMNQCEWGRGWEAFFGKWIQDLVTQDNGSFAEIIGAGKPDGPIVGMPMAFCSLDSARCDRTSNPEFPVVYTALDGKRFKLHYTRVAFSSIQPSPIAEMHDVGLCPVSKCLNIAQSLLDILIYHQEKLGSRPARNLMVTQGGLDPDDVKDAFTLANEAQNNLMLTRYSKTVVVGSAGTPDAKLEMHDLASVPDGFDYETMMSMGMATIALAFGVDARELWPMTGTGATRADALIQHIKAQTKGIGHLLALSEKALFSKILPDSIRAYFDYSDDAQDRQVAEIKQLRSSRHASDVSAELVDERVAREQMLWDDDLTQAQFEQLELQAGRLDDGTPILQLFYDPQYKKLLKLGLPNPLDTEANDLEVVKAQVTEVRANIIKKMGQEKAPRARMELNKAYFALDALLDWYEEANKPKNPFELGPDGLAKKPDEDGEGDDESVADQLRNLLTNEQVKPDDTKPDDEE